MTNIINELTPTPFSVIEQGGNIKVDSFSFPENKNNYAFLLGLPLSKAGLRVEFRNGNGCLLIEDKGIVVFSNNEEIERMALSYIYQLYLLHDGFLPICEVSFDAPKAIFRGFHLDCARHFFSLEEIKRLLKVFSLLGYNIFHWHLTDDQGWRFSVPCYDKLISVSSNRLDTEYNDGREYGGYYTDEEMKDVVCYASSLGITVIPEIETPGHAVALLASYPEFGCTGNKVSVETHWGVFEDVMNPASEALWLFLDKAVEKLVSIFPGKYIHIGGDECPHKEWTENSACLELMKREKLKDTMALQGWFSSKMASIVKKYGKIAIGWDEIIDAPNLDKSVIIQSWRGLEGAAKAGERGHYAILSPENGGCYFDRYQSHDSYEKGNLSYSPIKDSFLLDITDNPREYVLGAECTIWTEKIASGRELEYMVFPRAFALSENLWRGKERNWENFKEKRINIFKLCTALDIVFCPRSWD